MDVELAREPRVLPPLGPCRDRWYDLAEPALWSAVWWRHWSAEDQTGCALSWGRDGAGSSGRARRGLRLPHLARHLLEALMLGLYPVRVWRAGGDRHGAEHGISPVLPQLDPAAGHGRLPVPLDDGLLSLSLE